MKTSYFAKARRLQADYDRVVSIARGTPKWFDGESYITLAPPWEIVKIYDPERYTREYTKRVLSRLDAEMVYEDLENAVLLCYEKPGELCHRRIVAEWIESELGIVVPEYGFEMPKGPKPEQLEMF